MEILSFDDNKYIADKLLTKKYAAIVETDTIMGVISLNLDLIYQIKSRPREKKIVLFVSDINQIKSLNNNERTIISKYWPGALTIIKDGISYRIPNHDKLLELIKLTGPIYCSSANISNQPTIKDTNQAIQIFNQYKSKLMFVKGKNLTDVASTIINLDNYCIVRQGKVNAKEIINQLCQK